ncbi:hypothetical protein [Spongorhabdus nitratireducens]
MKKIFIFIPLLFSKSLFAADINEWYETEEGDYAIEEALHGSMYATLSESVAGDLSVYIEKYDEDKCDGSNEDVSNHEPVYINDVLVKMSQACNGSWFTIFPSSDKGRDYLINEFKVKRNVIIESYQNEYKLLFSAKGFSKSLKLQKLNKLAI